MPETGDEVLRLGNQKSFLDCAHLTLGLRGQDGTFACQRITGSLPEWRRMKSDLGALQHEVDRQPNTAPETGDGETYGSEGHVSCATWMATRVPVPTPWAAKPAATRVTTASNSAYVPRRSRRNQWATLVGKPGRRSAAGPSPSVPDDELTGFIACKPCGIIRGSLVFLNTAGNPGFRRQRALRRLMLIIQRGSGAHQNPSGGAGSQAWMASSLNLTYNTRSVSSGRDAWRPRMTKTNLPPRITWRAIERRHGLLTLRAPNVFSHRYKPAWTFRLRAWFERASRCLDISNLVKLSARHGDDSRHAYWCNGRVAIKRRLGMQVVRNAYRWNQNSCQNRG